MLALNENVVVKVIKSSGPTQTESGLYVHSSKNADDENVLFGEVIEKSDHGKEVSALDKIQLGSKVWFNKYNSNKIMSDGTEYVVVDVRNVLVVE